MSFPNIKLIFLEIQNAIRKIGASY